MSNVPKAGGADDIGERLTGLSEEFPGWTVKLTDTAHAPFQAVQDAADGSLTLGAGTVDGLAVLLDEADALGCGRARHALRDALRARGAEAYLSAVSIAIRARTGVPRTIGAYRGRFTWHDGGNLGPIADVDQVADEVMRRLDLEDRR
ncbi:hypothetical protein [Actinomadura sp. WMMA1423]|uniref:hypothetical protein n=1 Tax=Actinomadura sp. WMMA1423 TaxID=2591108 RepID=UPI0011461596|nr:hypothetical protein [Actinomadura sp. WMMA1423]